MFGAFRDLDPRGNVVIRSSDIPTTISTAYELLYHRMNQERYMGMRLYLFMLLKIHLYILSSKIHLLSFNVVNYKIGRLITKHANIDKMVIIGKTEKYVSIN